MTEAPEKQQPFINIDVSETGEPGHERIAVTVDQDLDEASDILVDLAQIIQGAISQRLMVLQANREGAIEQSPDSEQTNDGPTRH